MTEKIRRLPKPIKIVMIIIAAILFIILSFYYMSFRQLNQIISVSNRGTADIIIEDEIISEENQQKLTFVKKPKEEDFYVDGICIPLLKNVGIGEATFSCVAEYKVYDPYSRKVIQEVKKEKFTVTMEFSDWKWVVDTVYIDQRGF